MLLSEELEAYGVDLEPDEFRDVLIELHQVMHPSWNIEHLLYRPTNALRYCDAVRDRIHAKGLTEEFILRHLVNYRKAGRLSGKEE
jgi:hypothetical protein